MGGCTTRSRDEAERFQSDYNLVVNQIRLNTVSWKKFVSEVAFHGVLSRLSQGKVQAVMRGIGLEKEYRDEHSALRRFLVVTRTDQKCSAKELISVGLLMCKGNERERGEYLCSLLDSMSEKEALRDIPEKMKSFMLIAAKSIPELMAQVLNNPDTKLLPKLTMMDNDVLKEAIKQWIPKGRLESGKLLHDREQMIEWVAKGDLSPTRAVQAAVHAYNSVKGDEHEAAKSEFIKAKDP
eukprot:TRINITY_DN9926_c0_g1_i3.p1 TRINITY_DN9926_c0_g1~~TRINITY_DN9926_c0_g1_i3.p1  ORF type:complete len:238 (+),score=70.69 TRINITY_DN9926_c0_g1_i3:78-791(+)